MRNVIFSVAAIAAVMIVFSARSASAEVIAWDAPSLALAQGEERGSLVLLSVSSTPLFGYSLDIEIHALAGAVGTVTANTSSTNFYDARNLITAAGKSRDPVFSIISPTSDGVFITTNTDDLSSVTATPSVNDVLAQVFFVASEDALGSWEFRFGGGTALSDVDGFPVSFDAHTLMVTVIPAPASGLLAAGAAFMLRQRRRVATPA